MINDPVIFARLVAFFSVGACFALYRVRLVFAGKWAAVAALALTVLMFQPLLASLALATLGAYALFWLAFAQVPALQGFRNMDDVSYGLYLYGWPIQKLLDWYFPTVSPFVLLLAALVMSSLAGYASWHLVESMWLKRERNSKPITTPIT